MDIKDIIKEIDGLSVEKQKELYTLLTHKVKKRELLTQSLDEIRGIGKGIWNIDAQEYINKQRADDRI